MHIQQWMNDENAAPGAPAGRSWSWAVTRGRACCCRGAGRHSCSGRKGSSQHTSASLPGWEASVVMDQEEGLGRCSPGDEGWCRLGDGRMHQMGCKRWDRCGPVGEGWARGLHSGRRATAAAKPHLMQLRRGTHRTTRVCALQAAGTAAACCVRQAHVWEAAAAA